MQLSPDFRRELEDDSNAIAVLDDSGRIVFLNQAWEDHAVRDRAPLCRREALIGRTYIDFVLGELKENFADALVRARALGPELLSVWIQAECNTPEVCRELTTRISYLQVASQSGSRSCYMVHNELRIVCALADRYAVTETPVDELRDPAGLIVQCSCCRRVRDPHTRAWVMCVALLKRSDPLTSHGLCKLCMETYYGAALESERP